MMNYGMDYQGGDDGGYGGGGGGSGGGGGGFASQGSPASGNRPRNEDRTLTPVTICMLASSRTSDEDGSVVLADGRKLHHVRIVGAVRNIEDQSTNVVYSIEDGTGLVDVKQWINDDDCTAVTELRQAAYREHHYVKVVGLVKKFNNALTILADSVRPLSTGNELTHHMLEVVYAGEMHKKNGFSPVAGNGVGFGGPAARGAVPVATGVALQQQQQSNSRSSGLREDVIGMIRQLGDWNDEGANVRQVVANLVGNYSEAEIRHIIDDLSAEGHLYSTVDEEHYKFAT